MTSIKIKLTKVYIVRKILEVLIITKGTIGVDRKYFPGDLF